MKRGRPKNGEKLIEVQLIESRIELDYDKVLKEKSKLGKFILASNDINIVPDIILSYYKGQQEFERGFRFLRGFRITQTL